MIAPSRIFGVYEINGKKRRLFTKNAVPGVSVYGEKLFTEKGVEYREWDPSRSKLAALIMCGAGTIGLREGSIVLYLGVSTGTTASHVSDLVERGFVFGVDSAPDVMREFVFLAEQRKNIAPILADASHPETYAERIVPADVLYQDIAQREQAEIFVKNLPFLKQGGYALLVVKARSIDVRKKPKDLFTQARKYVEKHIPVIDFKILEPYQKDHCMILCKKP